MRFYYPPIGSNRRDHRICDLIDRNGPVTDQELIVAQFGEIPKGLHQDTPPEGVYEFKGMGGDPKLNPFSLLYRQAYIRGQKLPEPQFVDGELVETPPSTDPQTIYINRVLLGPFTQILNVIIGRAVIARAHDLLDLVAPEVFGGRLAFYFMLAGLTSSFRYAAVSSIAKGFAPSVADAVCEEQVHAWMLRDQNSWILKDSFRNAADNEIRRMQPWRQTYTRIMQGLDMILALMPVKGYKSDSEKSPRLYNLIARNYPSWGCIADTPQGFFEMLQDAGVKMPRYGQWHHSSRWFDANLLNLKGYINPPTAELNLGLNATRSKDTLMSMIMDCLPLLYADLRVKMGDSKGYARMGYDVNDRDGMGIPRRSTKPLLTHASAGQSGPANE